MTGIYLDKRVAASGLLELENSGQGIPWERQLFFMALEQKDCAVQRQERKKN